MNCRSSSIFALALACSFPFGAGCGDSGETGGAGGGSASSAMDVPCATPADCPLPGNVCVQAVCLETGICGTIDVPAGQPLSTQALGDCKKTVCDGAGNPEDVPDDTDVHQSGACSNDSCSMGMSVHTPIAGPCSENGGAHCGDPSGPDAGKCIECNVPADCASGICKAGSCAAPSCDDGVPNGDETDVDCGGSCPPCDPPEGCAIDDDCTSGFCDPLALTCAAPTCTDGYQNGGETDLDCGGPACPNTCTDGSTCLVGDDCSSGFCSNGACAPCVLDTDCDSGLFCNAGVCGASPASCGALHASSPTAPSGVYSIDPDGPGGLAPFSVYCDMTTAGGGWTLVLHTWLSNVYPPAPEFAQSYAEWQSNGIGSAASYTDPTSQTFYVMPLEAMRVLVTSTASSLRFQSDGYVTTSELDGLTMNANYGFGGTNVAAVAADMCTTQATTNCFLLAPGFSSADVDHDSYPAACTSNYAEVGYWYDQCYSTNAFATGGSLGGSQWYSGYSKDATTQHWTWWVR